MSSMTRGALAALLGLAIALAGGSVAQELGPRIRFDSEVHDFGKMHADEKKTHRWAYRNEGSEPLEIVRTRTSCGCTATAAQADPVAPGEQGAIEVTFDAAGQHGSVRKTITVSSNDPVNPRVRLTIQADVLPPAQPERRDGHPPLRGQSLLAGECATCHAAPAAGKSGIELYAAVCEMCHGERGKGVSGRAPSLLDEGFVASRTDEELVIGITYGTANPRMPGFSEMMGGPLTDEQVESLVRLLREWAGSGADAN